MRVATLVLAALLSALALVQVRHKALKGQNALLKWRPYAERLERGEELYAPIEGVSSEGYPTLPLSLLVLREYMALGPLAGPLAWAATTIALAWLVVLAALRLAAGRARDFPAVGALVVFLLSYRVLASDVLHGNVNVAVGATVVLAGLLWHRGRELGAGVAIGLGAVLKVTPALFVLWLARKRSLRGLVGVVLGGALFAFALPALVLGWRENLAQIAGFWAQMVAPYLGGRELGLVQTEHINQSLLGVLARLFTDAVAIPARPQAVPEDVRVTLVELAPAAFRALHLASCAAVLAVLVLCVRPRERGAESGERTLGELALGALAMVFLSERSWKHHYVLLALPLAYLVWTVSRGRLRDLRSRGALAALVASAFLNGLSGSAVIGDHGSNLAEAYGVHLAGGLALFAACALALRTDAAARDARGAAASEPERRSETLAPTAPEGWTAADRSIGSASTAGAARAH